jgi:hypothetical protein
MDPLAGYVKLHGDWQADSPCVVGKGLAAAESPWQSLWSGGANRWFDDENKIAGLGTPDNRPARRCLAYV